IPGRFRYQVQSGRLLLTVKLLGMAETKDAAVAATAAKVAEATGATVLFGSFVLGGGLTALSFERLRSRVARMADDLDHMRWALEDLHQEGQLRADPPGDRWARLKRAGALAPAAPA